MRNAGCMVPATFDDAKVIEWLVILVNKLIHRNSHDTFPRTIGQIYVYMSICNHINHSFFLQM